MKTNFEKIQDLIKVNHLDGLLLMSRENRLWMVGHANSIGSGYYLADQEHSIYYVNQAYTFLQEPGQTRDCEVKVVAGSNLVSVIYEDAKKFGIKRLGLDTDYIVYNLFEKLKKQMPEIELVPVSTESLRLCKTTQEIEYIEKAARISDESWQEVCKNFKLGQTENDIENELFKLFVKKGADKEFPRVIITAGERGMLPHGRPSDKVIVEGELLTIDGGAVYKGYRADMTRTVAIGEVSDKLKEICEVVKQSQAAGFRALKPGVKASEIHKICWNVINDAGYGKYFFHSTGHGIGLECHEAPLVGLPDDQPLQAGMTLTLEPGIYIKDVGSCRIEDVYLITETGARPLNNLIKEPVNILKEELAFIGEQNVKINKQ